jgi:hypothetical protein
MHMTVFMNRVALVISFCLSLVCSSVCGFEMRPSVFNQELQNIKYEFTVRSLQSGTPEASVLFSDEGFSQGAPQAAPGFSYKSPGKAFLLSLAVPGLGQYRR